MFILLVWNLWAWCHQVPELEVGSEATGSESEPSESGTEESDGYWRLPNPEAVGRVAVTRQSAAVALQIRRLPPHM